MKRIKLDIKLRGYTHYRLKYLMLNYIYIFLGLFLKFSSLDIISTEADFPLWWLPLVGLTTTTQINWFFWVYVIELKVARHLRLSNILYKIKLNLFLVSCKQNSLWDKHEWAKLPRSRQHQERKNTDCFFIILY